MKTTDFPRLLSDFLLKELPSVRNQSSNTIASYRDTYIRLLTYCRDKVKLTGKGRKTRSVPLMDRTVVLLKNYLSEQRLDTPSSFEHPLFFNSQGKKLSRQGIAYILKKYANECGIDKISPHGMRHTKAMHLTEADVNPIFIRDFLGHTDLKVTEIYSKTSIKMKKAALDKMKSGKDIIPEKPLKDWTEDKSLLDWLNGLKH